MIFTREPASNRITATLSEAHSEKTYHCTISMCSSPTCGCEIINIDFLPEDHTDGALSHATPSTVNIDLGKWRNNDQERLLNLSEFAENVLKNLDEDDYQFLMRIFLSGKHMYTEKADFSTLDADFPIADIENKNLMVAYLEIIPFAKQFEAEINNQRYFVDDQYCVKLNCVCSEVHLTFVALNPTQTEVNENQEAFNFLINYKKHIWKKVAGENISSVWSADDDMAKKAFESAYPDFWRLVQTRHRQMKQVYANSMKQRKQSKPVASPEKIGRNEPCPCGSGKKYKKCCGAN